MNNRVLIGVIIGLVLIGITMIVPSCSIDTNEHKGLGDSPVRQVKDVEVKAYPNGDTFPNISAFCIGVDGVYTNTRAAGAMQIVPDDPNCKNGELPHAGTETKAPTGGS